jgi:peptide/nickel transport system permease protein
VLARMTGNVTPATIRSLELAYGINSNQSLLAQYFSFWGRLLHGNLGISTSSYPATVASVIGGALPWTLGLVGLATLISFGLGTALGVLVAWRRGTWLDNLLPATTFLQAAPYFFVAFLALQLFSAKLGWFPSVGAYNQGTDFPGWNLTYVGDVLHHAVLPALTIVVCSVAGWIVGTRNVMLTTMDEDYVLIAQAKGLPKRRVIWYAARNAVLPSVSGFSLAIGFVVSGALLTEIVFSYPGIGFMLLQGVGERDYPLLQGIFLVITFAVLAANLIADCVYIFLDPRIRQEA